MKNNAKMSLIALALLCTFGASPAIAQTKSEAPAKSTIKTYALIVANNGSIDEGVQPLKYADDDGARYYETFSHMANDTTLLTVLDADSQRVFPKLAAKTQAPTRANLRNRVKALAAKIKKDQAKGIKSEVYLVFTGHGNVDKKGQGYLSLQDGKLRRQDLFTDVIKPLQHASFTHLIIDACHAYFMVQSRSGKWKDDRSGKTLDDGFHAYIKGNTKKARKSLPSTLGVILSTSGTAEVHEWSRYRAGVFSHQLRSGLLGGADVNHDGHITYIELEAYLAAANAGVTNPKAKISVYAKAPSQNQQHPLLTLSRFKNTTTLNIPKGSHKRLTVEDARGIRYADLHRDPSQPGRLILLKQPVGNKAYYLSTGTTQAKVPLNKASISTTALAFNKVDNQARSSVEESYRTKLFTTPFGPGFFAGFQAGRLKPQNEQRTIYIDRPTSSWQPHLEVGYGLSAPLLNLSGIQHNFNVRLPLEHSSGWVLAPTIAYGLGNHTNGDGTTLQGIAVGESLTVHRLNIGLSAGYRVALNGAKTVHLEPLVGLGYQGVFMSGENNLNADPLGLRAEAGLRLGYQWAPGWTTHFHGGLAANILRRANLEGSEQFTYSTPFIMIEQRFF